MRTKTLILTAALTAAGMTAASAQVFSVNAVGYVKKTVPDGQFALLSNPLNATGEDGNSLEAVLPDAPAGVTVYEFSSSAGGYGIYERQEVFGELSWTGTGAGGEPIDDIRLDPDEGFFIQNESGSDLELVFVGEVPQGELTTTVPAGFSLLGSQVPQEGALHESLEFPTATLDDRIFLFRDGGYLEGQFQDVFGSQVWTGNAVPQGENEPIVQVAEGFFYENSAGNSRSWTRNFDVNSQ